MSFLSGIAIGFFIGLVVKKEFRHKARIPRGSQVHRS